MFYNFFAHIEILPPTGVKDRIIIVWVGFITLKCWILVLFVSLHYLDSFPLYMYAKIKYQWWGLVIVLERLEISNNTREIFKYIVIDVVQGQGLCPFFRIETLCS